MSNSIWIEKYRPDTLENYIGNEKIKVKFKQYIEEQDIPHLLLHGVAGTGKTTAAKILIKNIECDSIIINASDERGIDVIRDKIKNFASSRGFYDLKIVFLDEADYLTPDAQAALRNTMEVYSERTRFILTCNYLERITSPIVSRTQVMGITPPSKKEVALHLKGILEKENVVFDVKSIATLVNGYYPDIRRIIGMANQNVVDGKLEMTINEVITGDYKLKVLDALMSNLPAKDKVKEIRQIVADADVRDFAELYRYLYDKVDDYNPSKVPQSILAIAEGQYRDSLVVDKEINFIATVYNMFNN